MNGVFSKVLPVIDLQDHTVVRGVGGQRQLIASAGGIAGESGEEGQTRVSRRILDLVAGLVREFAEVHFQGV